MLLVVGQDPLPGHTAFAVTLSASWCCGFHGWQGDRCTRPDNGKKSQWHLHVRRIPSLTLVLRESWLRRKRQLAPRHPSIPRLRAPDVGTHVRRRHVQRGSWRQERHATWWRRWGDIELGFNWPPSCRRSRGESPTAGLNPTSVGTSARRWSRRHDPATGRDDLGQDGFADC